MIISEIIQLLTMDISKASSLAQIVAAVFVGIQVYLIFKENRDAHRRIKKKDTLHAMSEFLRTIRDERLWLLAKENVERLQAPESLTQYEYLIAEQFLGSAERLAIGVRNEVYDTTIIRQTSRRYLTDSFGYFSAYIAFKRKKLRNPAIFEHYEWLVNELK